MSIILGVVRGDAPTTAGVQTFTKSGVGTPVAAVFLVTNCTADATDTDHAMIGAGFTDGTTDYTTASQSEDAQTTNDSDRSQQDNHCIHVLNTSGGIDGEADFDAWITDGVRIDWTNAPSSAVKVECWLIGGTDAVGNTGRTNIGASTNIAHGLGETPKLVCMLGTTGSANGISTQFNFSFGIVGNNDGVIQQFNLQGGQNSGSSASTNPPSSRLHTDRCFGSIANGATPSISRDFKVTAMDATNITVTRQTGSFGGDPQWLAIGFGSATNKVDIVAFDGPTATGTQSVTNDDSFEPQFVLIAAAHNQAANTLENEIGIAIGLIDESLLLPKHQ